MTKTTHPDLLTGFVSWHVTGASTYKYYVLTCSETLSQLLKILSYTVYSCSLMSLAEKRENINKMMYSVLNDLHSE